MPEENLVNEATVPFLVDNPSVIVSLHHEEWRLLTFINGQDNIVALSQKTDISLQNVKKIIIHLLQLGVIGKNNVFKTWFY